MKHFFTLPFTALVIVSAAQTHANPIALSASDNACINGAINFSEVQLDHFGDQDITDEFDILDDGCTLALTGNTWKFTDSAYDLTPNTVLMFDFMSAKEGEIHGILFDTTNPVTGNGGRTFQVYGNQDWGIRDFTYTTPGEYQALEIPVGAYLNGSMFIGFASDDDANAMSESYFRNVRLVESDTNTPSMPNPSLSAIDIVSISDGCHVDVTLSAEITDSRSFELKSHSLANIMTSETTDVIAFDRESCSIVYRLTPSHNTVIQSAQIGISGQFSLSENGRALMTLQQSMMDVAESDITSLSFSARQGQQNDTFLGENTLNLDGDAQHACGQAVEIELQVRTNARRGRSDDQNSHISVLATDTSPIQGHVVMSSCGSE